MFTLEIRNFLVKVLIGSFVKCVAHEIEDNGNCSKRNKTLQPVWRVTFVQYI